MSEKVLPEKDMKDIDNKFWKTIELETTYHRVFNRQQKNKDKR